MWGLFCIDSHFAPETSQHHLQIRTPKGVERGEMWVETSSRISQCWTYMISTPEYMIAAELVIHNMLRVNSCQAWQCWFFRNWLSIWCLKLVRYNTKEACPCTGGKISTTSLADTLSEGNSSVKLPLNAMHHTFVNACYGTEFKLFHKTRNEQGIEGDEESTNL